jgi:hypothetical protein
MTANSFDIRPIRGVGLFDHAAESTALLTGAAPNRVDAMLKPGLRAVCGICFLVLMSSFCCYASDVLLIRSAEIASPEQRQLELATQFYGVNLKVVTAGDRNFGSALRTVRQNVTLAVAIQAEALAAVNQDELLGALQRRVPLLILGVTPETHSIVLSAWSSGAAVGARSLESPFGLHYVVGRVAGITQQLTDLEIPFPGNNTVYFSLTGDGKAQEIMGVRNDRQIVPVFIEADLHGQKVFLLSRTHLAADNAAEAGADTIETAFAELAPMMMFVKYVAGERGWHTLHHYANLTIDDPWLREPYGDVSYQGLLAEMEKHNFHTTIAFIPWNYDRSEVETVSLFRNHPERFSICIHGDNHDHKEFEDLASKPLNTQVAALKQSLARMEKFQILTGIPYDNVFVFPHSIGTESILEELKTYNFLATVNSSNVPMDRVRPSKAPLFALRPVTLSFADFPSISRYSATMQNPNGFLGINEFLDNPLFFYIHHDFFASGIDAFNGMADAVNKREPDTQWRGVGDIVKHLYLVRLRDGSHYDVLTFSSTFDLDNSSEHSSVFDIEKQESGSPPIASVSVDGRDHPFQLRGGYLALSLSVPARGVRSVVIRYKNGLTLASTSTSKASLRVYLLRNISGFRDITLSKYRLGRALIDYYYKGYDDKHGTTPLLVFVGGGMILVFFTLGGCWGVWAIMKRKKTVAKNPDVLRNAEIVCAAQQK